MSVDTPSLPVSAAGEEIRRTGRDEWIELTSRFRDHNYRHCWDYAALMAERSGATAENLAVLRDGVPIGLASVRVKRLPGTGVAYVTGGPLVRLAGQEDHEHRLERVLIALTREYTERRHMVLRVAPAIGDPDWNQVQSQRFAAAGFDRAEHLPAYRTILVDIERPLDAVRIGLAQKWRNCLNKAERSGIRVVEGQDPKLFADFAPLFHELVSRKSFDVTLGPDFYARVQELLPASERLHVAIAWVDDQPAAGVVASIHGDTAVYLLGASNAVGRKANAAYLLQWNVIETASRAGCGVYDLGGTDPDGNPGVYKFKLGFGGQELCAPGPFERSPGRLRGAAVHAAERAYRALAARRSD